MGNFLVILPALLQLLLELLLPLNGDGHLTLVLTAVDHILHPLNLAGVNPLEPVEMSTRSLPMVSGV